jgi:diadenosine tetraphosphate (Ap4A) HIT family hydrolase
MPDLNDPELGPCVFCSRDRTRNVFLYESDNFYVIADHAPIAEAHLLLIPHGHYPHLAALPEHLHDEFESLKAMMGGFVEQNYGALTYWENGVFGQSVPHAHLHAISVAFDPYLYIDQGRAFSGIAGMQEQHEGGHYFMIEQQGEGRLLPPDWELYLSVVRYARHSRPINWRFDREERQRRGGPIVEALKRRWRQVMQGTPSPLPGGQG